MGLSNRKCDDKVKLWIVVISTMITAEELFAAFFFGAGWKHDSDLLLNNNKTKRERERERKTERRPDFPFCILYDAFCLHYIMDQFPQRVILALVNVNNSDTVHFGRLDIYGSYIFFQVPLVKYVIGNFMGLANLTTALIYM